MKSSLTAAQKAAVLIATLDRQTADLLLAQMTPDEAARVRRAVIELDDIPEEMAAAALAEFRGVSAGRKRPATHDVTWEPSGETSNDAVYSVPAALRCDRYPPGLEIDDRLAAHMAKHAPEPAAEDAAPRRPFRSLHEAEPSVLASFFEQEHPQTIAVVFAHLAAEQAADVLARLPDDLQAEVLQRLADLNDTDDAVVREIEAGIESWLTEQDRRRRRRRAGLSQIEKILASAELGAKETMLQNLQRHDATLAEHFGVAQPAAAFAAISSTEVSAPSATTPLTVEPPAVETVPQRRKPQRPARRTPSRVARPALQFDELERLSDHALALVFGEADPVVVQLALAGAPQRLMQRLLQQLSPREARALRKSLDQFGPVRLQDIEASQRRLAELATELLHSGRFTLAPARAAA